jgi:hypothetical protein
LTMCPVYNSNDRYVLTKVFYFFIKVLSLRWGWRGRGDDGRMESLRLYGFQPVGLSFFVSHF